jgi:16S rRNA (guanine966-N2)-methyltransferase
LRIIAGKYKGRRLKTPRGSAIRPTADRIREAIFNILGGGCRDRQVFDIFAGTGALGLEALSRGANRAVFVDNRRTAVDAIRRNIAVCGCEENSAVFLADVRRQLDCLNQVERTAELVFLDPPYQLDLIRPALQHLVRRSLVAPEARLVIEHSVHEALPELEGHFRLDDRRRYGKTLVSFLTYMV